MDVTLVEGAISSEDDLYKIKQMRHASKVLIALGDCAMTGNMPSMRNMFPLEKCCTASTWKTRPINQHVPTK